MTGLSTRQVAELLGISSGYLRVLKCIHKFKHAPKGTLYVGQPRLRWSPEAVEEARKALALHRKEK